MPRTLLSALAAVLVVPLLVGCSSRAPTIRRDVGLAAVTATVHGCGPNGKHIPTEFVDKRTIPDVDLDGKPDALVHWLHPDTWGVKTAAGAVITVRSPNPDPSRWHGWMYQLEADPAVMVIDDGEQANPYFLTGCHFTRPENVQGKPYVFSLYPHDGYGTGVTCFGDDKGGYQLAGVYAAKQQNDRYRVQTTVVFSRDGKIARNSRVQVGLTSFTASSATVENARRSYCPKTPLISGHDNGGR